MRDFWSSEVIDTYRRMLWFDMTVYPFARFEYKPRLFSGLYPSPFFTEPTTTGPDYVEVIYSLPEPYRAHPQ